MTNDKVVDTVIQEFADRSKEGQLKYGKTLTDAHTEEGLLGWLENQKQELMDGILYLQAAIDSIKEDHTVVGYRWQSGKAQK